METVMILGAGYMENGIAQVCVNGGYRVLLWDITSELVEGQEMGRKSGRGWCDYSAGEKRPREDL